MRTTVDHWVRLERSVVALQRGRLETVEIGKSGAGERESSPILLGLGSQVDAQG